MKDHNNLPPSTISHESKVIHRLQLKTMKEINQNELLFSSFKVALYINKLALSLDKKRQFNLDFGRDQKFQGNSR